MSSTTTTTGPKRKRRKKKIVNEPPVRLVMAAMALGVIVGALYAPDKDAFGSDVVARSAEPDESADDLPVAALAQAGDDGMLD